MENHPMAWFVKASVVAIALTGLAGCEYSGSPQGSAGDVEQTDTMSGAQTDAPAVGDQPAPVVPGQ